MIVSKITRTWLNFLLGLVLLGKIFAQEEVVRGQLSVVHLGKRPADSLLYYKDEGGENYRKIRCLSSDVSKPISYVGKPNFALYRPNGQEEGLFDLEARVTIPRDIERAILLVVPDSDKRPKVLVIDASLKAFPIGSRVMMNFTDRKLRGIVTRVGARDDKDKKQYMVTPKQSVLIPSIDSKAKQIQAYISIIDQQEKGQEKWCNLRSSRWFQIPGQRQILVVYGSNGKVRMKGISDSNTTE